MSEVVVGGSFLSPIIQVICERLASTDFRGYFREGLVKKVEITLISINEVLDDAETKQYEDLDVKNWVDDVSNDVFELEQLSDVVATDAAQEKGKIQRYLSGSINQFESRMKVLFKRLIVLADQKDKLGLQGKTWETNVSLGKERLLFFVDESVIYGREHEKEEMIDFLLSDSHGGYQVPIISVVGLMGMGKTALTRLVYNDHRIQKQFELMVWVHVSETYDHDRLIESILRSISVPPLRNEGTEISTRLQQRLAGKKYLIVLDDVWIKNKNMLERLLLPFNRVSSRGRMIVTTCDKDVALIMRSTRILHLKQLEESHSWSLFVRYAFQRRNEFEYPNLESIGKKIVAKCGGRPFALIKFGNILCKKFSEPEWIEILESLPEGDSNINSVLRMSYLNLPPNLKRSEVVVGGSSLSAFIQVICERLASTDFRGYFREELVKKLKITLISINKVLNDAETRQYHNLDLNNWLDDVSNEVYELEQLLDVIATVAAQQKGKIQRFLSGFINRFESRIKVLFKRLAFLAEQIHRFGLHKSTNYYYEDGARDFATSSFMDESIIYGREHVKEEIINFLLSDSYNDELSVISIVGLMGMGKTALAQLVYNDHRIQEQFEFKAWVHVSESFDCHRLINEILDHRLQHRLAGNKYLLVLDDARIKNRNMLEDLLPLFNLGYFRGKMIVTTNDKEVASVMRSTRIIHLRQLEESDSWSLFVRHAFEGRNMFEYPNLELIGKKIVEKCGGLPLALKTLGILLQRKFSETEWVKLLETDLWRLPKGDSSSIYSVLRMSYLSFPSGLKHCFAYCSIFPKGL